MKEPAGKGKNNHPALFIRGPQEQARNKTAEKMEKHCTRHEFNE